MGEKKQVEPTATLIARIRQEIGCGRVPTADVLRLCERTEEILSSSLKMERALHDSIKVIEKRKSMMNITKKQLTDF